MSKPAEIHDLPYPDNAAQLFAKIRHLPDAVWLDSGKPESLSGRFDLMAAAPDMVLETLGATTRITTANTSHTDDGDPFALAQAALEDIQISAQRNDFFNGGLIGFWGYNMGRHVLTAPFRPKPPINFPDMRLGRYLWSIVLNHPARQAQLVCHPACPPARKREVLRLLQSQDVKQPSPFMLSEVFRASETQRDYAAALAKIHDYILAGDCYQVNYAQHFQAPFAGDPWQAYLAVRRVLPAPFSAYLDCGDGRTLLSFSPERFIKLSSGRVESKPIKGTIKRGATLRQDQQNALQLQQSSKDRAENLMIVDLLRNDMGKVCAPGSIRVPKLFALESYANVHHLVSTVTGTLTASATALSLLRSCFPGGSITGAPKKRAMEIIDELERQQRAVYCGSIGYIGCNDRMDTNIAIRTLAATDGYLHCWGGGGIVADSVTEQEYQESLDKVSLLMKTLERIFLNKSGVAN